MKKKVANAVELGLLLVSFVLLWLPMAAVKPAGLMSDDITAPASMIGLMAKGAAYIVFALYAIIALMCLISILSKKNYRDGILHIIMPVILFFYLAAYTVGKTDTVAGDFAIVENRFPTMLFLAIFVLIIAISIIKRTAMIAGLPKMEIEATYTQADELKKFKELLDAGAITQEEFDEKKQQLLKKKSK